MVNTVYDYIIIGAGLAGLYSAYLIKKCNPNINIIILEKEKKDWIGGRIGNEQFYNNEIVTGAGIGRKQKDYLLLSLLKTFNLPIINCSIQMNYAKTIKNPVNILNILKFLKKKYKQNPSLNLTFKEFALPILGKKLYKNFTICSGYTDYEKEDAFEVLFNYGFEDNNPGWDSFIVPWKKLVLKLIQFINPKNIKTLENIIEIKKLTNNEKINIFEIINENKNFYLSKNIIIATTITSLVKLLPLFPIYKQIKGQPFLRVYGKFSPESNNLLKHFIPYQTIVPGPLHKIIPLKNGVYMIAYTDNLGALSLKNNLENTLENRKLFEKLLEKSLGIEDCSLDLLEIKSFYWPIGTHYFKPLENFKDRNEFLEKAQHPFPGIYVIGEMVSMNQGWTEGALESVEAIKKDILKGCI